MAWTQWSGNKCKTWLAIWYCMGGRCKDQGSNHHSGKLHGWQAQRSGIWQSIRFTAPVAGAHTNIFKSNLVNCSEGGRKDQQFENLHGWQAQRTRMQLDPTITITLVNCTGGRQTRDPTINPLNSTGWQAQTPSFSKSIWSTARWQAQEQKFWQAIP